MGMFRGSDPLPALALHHDHRDDCGRVFVASWWLWFLAGSRQFATSTCGMW